MEGGLHLRLPLCCKQALPVSPGVASLAPARVICLAHFWVTNGDLAKRLGRTGGRDKCSSLGM